MPQSTSSQATGDFGETYVRTIIETGWRCLLIPHWGRDRFGIDGMVIDVVNGEIQPFQFNVQIKTGNFTGRKRSAEFLAPVHSEHLLFWKQLNVPVVLVCVDTTPPTTAYWRLIAAGDTLPVYMSRRKILGPGSRDGVIGAVRKVVNQNQDFAIDGKVLNLPLQSGVRNIAKAYYRKLKSELHCHPTYGPMKFTWRGWRHITRKKRSIKKIAHALQLLPSVPEIIRSAINPVSSRELDPVEKGNYTLSRTLLVFEPTIKISHRADARIRLVIERDTIFPKDWATTDPKDSRRVQVCRFLSLSEIPQKRKKIEGR